LDQAQVRSALEVVLACAPDEEFRLVGTASCLLRGIEMAASDVDVLFRSREAVDAWIGALVEVAEVADGPIWLEGVSQYFARLDVAGVTVELSTVEVETGSDADECIGSGPWVHFEHVPCGRFRIPVVALELRLVSEVARQRVDRVNPLVAHLRAHSCDLALVERGLIAHATPPEKIAALVASLAAG
jgi:hypothetical protein